MTYMSFFALIALYFVVRQIWVDIFEALHNHNSKQWNKGWLDGRTYEKSQKKGRK